MSAAYTNNFCISRIFHIYLSSFSYKVFNSETRSFIACNVTGVVFAYIKQSWIFLEYLRATKTLKKPKAKSLHSHSVFFAEESSEQFMFPHAKYGPHEATEMLRKTIYVTILLIPLYSTHIWIHYCLHVSVTLPLMYSNVQCLDYKICNMLFWLYEWKLTVRKIDQK